MLNFCQMKKEVLVKNSRLKTLGLKETPARLAIISVFEGNHTPLSAEDVWRKMKTKKVNLATIYRNIISLEKGGVLTRIDLRKPSNYYELKDSLHHHHITCSSCGVFEDISFCDEELVSKALKGSSRFSKISDHSLEFFGICKKCTK